MNSRRLRRRRSWAQLAAVGSLLVAALPALRPVSARAALRAPDIVAVRGVPSALGANYGPAVSLPGGVIAAPTGTGVEFFDGSQAGVPLLGRFRTPGPIARGAAAGNTLFLFAGVRGVVAVDASNASAPVAVGSVGELGPVGLGAAALTGGGVLAAFGSTIQFLTWDPASGFSLRRTLTYSDGRLVRAIAARGDSFVVASVRNSTRLILDTYRMRGGVATPDSLDEMAFNGHEAEDIAWSGNTLFVADANAGILTIDLPTRAIRGVTPISGASFARSVDANDSVVVVATGGFLLARFTRTGAANDSLVQGASRTLTGNGAYARLSGDWAVASTYDQIAPAPPDEPGWSRLELISLSGGAEPPPTGAVGRARRVAVKNGLAYVADYSGGLRIYRSGGGDSSLVGVAPASGNARPVDVAVDPSLPLVYLASGAGGLEVIQTGNPAAPIAAASLTVPGSATAVTPLRSGLAAVAWRGITPGIQLVQVDYNPVDSTVALIPRGQLGSPTVQDPRALAARDTVLFVADETLGLYSIRCGNPDLPALHGAPTLTPARDLDLTGTQLLVATRTRGLQIVDVNNPVSPILRSEFPAPPLLGVTRNGATAVAFAGDEGAMAVDVGTPTAPVYRGPIAPPGTPRDGWWSGDTLLVAASLGLERYLAHPTPTAVAALDAHLDPASATPRAVITWPVLAPGGLVGFNLYRDRGTSDAPEPAGGRVNRDLLPPGTTSAVDDSVTAGVVQRYRLEAYLSDGSAVKVAEGTLAISSAPLVGRVAPNPFRPRSGALARLGYRLPASAAGAILTLRVFDTAGRLVRESKTPAAPSGGFGAIGWDGRDRNGAAVPSGVYYLRLTGAGLDDSRTVVLLR